MFTLDDDEFVLNRQPIELAPVLRNMRESFLRRDAIGYVIGSSLVNLLLVVGGIALVSPAHGLAVPASFLRLEWPAALVFALMLLPVLRGDLRVSRNEGIGLLVALVAWIAFELVLLQR